MTLSHKQPTDKESLAHVIDLTATYQSHIKILRLSHITDPPTIDIYLYGLGKDGKTKYLITLPVASDNFLVLEEIMKVFRCGCSSENSCKSRKFRLPCSTFCECGEGISYMNLFNRKARNEEDKKEHVSKE